MGKQDDNDDMIIVALVHCFHASQFNSFFSLSKKTSVLIFLDIVSVLRYFPTTCISIHWEVKFVLHRNILVTMTGQIGMHQWIVTPVVTGSKVKVTGALTKKACLPNHLRNLWPTVFSSPDHEVDKVRYSDRAMSGSVVVRSALSTIGLLTV
jgi:hypothetical protein